MATLKNTVIDSTGYLQLPVGNTAQRPGNATNGMMRFNSDTSSFEVFNAAATAWNTVGAGPVISQIQITDSSYNVLDDTAVNTAGGYIKITGSGFSAGAVVIIGSVNATSTTVVSNTVLNVQVPAAVAGTYTVYVVNSGGGTAIGVNGLTYSALPTWTTGSSLPSGVSGTPVSIQLAATDATSFALAAGNTLPSGLTLTSGGLLSGTVTVGSETTYSFTVIATDAQAQDSPRAFTITISVGDPYFYLTTLLLPGNGTNNGTNNTFVDGSTNNLTLTRTGNVTQGTYTPYSLTGWSNYFDGTGDYLNFSGAANNAMGSGDFTIEGWFYLTGTTGQGGSGEQGIIGVNTVAASRLTVRLQGTSTKVMSWWLNGAGNNIAGSTAIQQNTWYHFALVRSGGATNNVKLYLNGVLESQATSTYDVPVGDYVIGRTYTDLNGEYWNGYFSNIRAVKGTALYTSNFTPPTSPLTAIANTSFLTCQNSYFKDNSTNNFTITRNGDTSVQSFSPFAPSAGYSTSTVSGSLYMDGSDYLTPANSTATDLGIAQQPFTLEWWTYFTTTSGGQYIICKGGGVGGWNSTNGWQYILSIELSSNVISLGYYNGSSYTYWQPSFSSVGVLGKWCHMAMSYNGTNLSFYVNGVRIGTTTVTNFTKPSASDKCGIGSTFGVAGESYYYNGYISNFRIVQGTAVYDPTLSTLTVPTAPLTAISGTSLLLLGTNGQITDATGKNLLETVGDAKISTAQSKWGGSSIYLDGTGDWLPINAGSNNMLNLGSNNFTIEAWVYTTATSQQCIIGSNANGDGSGSYMFNLNYNSNKLRFYCRYAGGSTLDYQADSGTFPTNAWTHVAVTRNGSSLRMFINGTQVGTTSTTLGTSAIDNSLSNYNIGRTTDSALPFTGYINDLRTTRGYARYTSNFTPPTGAFPTQ